MNDAFTRSGELTKPLAPLVLPAVYDDVLSYEEWLSKVVARCNELTEYIAETIEHIDEHIDEQVDARIDVYLTQRLTPIQEEVARLQQDLLTMGTQLNEKIDGLDEKIDTETAQIYSKIASEIREINIKMNILSQTLTTDFDTKLANAVSELQVQMSADYGDLLERINGIIKEYPRLYNPATGFMEDMQTLVFNLYGRLRYFGIEAMLYDDQLMTAEEYDDQSFTAIKYDTLVGRVLFHDLKSMFNPFTGEWESVQDVLTAVIRKLQWNGKTAGEYDGYEYTAEDFDDSSFNAYEQDTNQYITSPQTDYKNKAYKNYLFEGTMDTVNTQLSVVVGDKKQIILSQADSPVNVISDIRDADILLPSGDTVNISVLNGTAILTYIGSEAVSVYSSTDVFDVNDLDK